MRAAAIPPQGEYGWDKRRSRSAGACARAPAYPYASHPGLPHVLRQSSKKQDRARDPAGPGREADIDWLTLSFPKGLEEEFRRDYALKSVRHVRFGIGLALALWTLFGLLDP